MNPYRSVLILTLLLASCTTRKLHELRIDTFYFEKGLIREERNRLESIGLEAAFQMPILVKERNTDNVEIPTELAGPAKADYVYLLLQKPFIKSFKKDEWTNITVPRTHWEVIGLDPAQQDPNIRRVAFCKTINGWRYVMVYRVRYEQKIIYYGDHILYIHRASKPLP